MRGSYILTYSIIKMEVLKVTAMKDLASGNKFCAHVRVDGRQSTGFGKTEDEAISKAKLKVTKGLRIIKK